MAPKKLLTLDQIRDAKDIGEEIVDVPEWGGSVKVRGLKQGEVADVYAKLSDEEGEITDIAGFSLELVQRGTVDPEIPAEALPELREKSWLAVSRISGAVSRLSGLGQDALVEAQKSFRASS